MFSLWILFPLCTFSKCYSFFKSFKRCIYFLLSFWSRVSEWLWMTVSSVLTSSLQAIDSNLFIVRKTAPFHYCFLLLIHRIDDDTSFNNPKQHWCFHSFHTHQWAALNQETETVKCCDLPNPWVRVTFADRCFAVSRWESTHHRLMEVCQ